MYLVYQQSSLCFYLGSRGMDFCMGTLMLYCREIDVFSLANFKES